MSPRRQVGTTRKHSLAKGRSADRLTAHLGHEDLTTTSLEVARMWENAYSELVDFEESRLARVRKRMPLLSEAARHEAELTNLPMIVAHLQTFKYRVGFWRGRRLELEQR